MTATQDRTDWEGLARRWEKAAGDWQAQYENARSNSARWEALAQGWLERYEETKRTSERWQAVAEDWKEQATRVTSPVGRKSATARRPLLRRR